MAIINGTSGNDSLVGTTGADSITGSGGNDTLVGNGGKDTLNGGSGNDVYIIDSADDSIAGEGSFTGNDTIETTFDFGTTALRAYIENLTLRGSVQSGYGNSLANVIRGNDLNNALFGDTGADTIYGGGGNDNILGGSGTFNDVLYGEAGNDFLDGDAGNDILDGGADNDNLYGGAGTDSLIGGAGTDLLVGGEGTDTLVGGEGGDTYELTATDGSDVINETGTTGRDLVRAGLTYSLATRTTIEDLTLTGATAINATGNAQANVLTGNSANNRLDGGAGDDTLIGGAGTDTLVGGDGADVYVLTASDVGDVLEETGVTGRDRIEAGFTTTIATRAQFEDITLTGVAAINAIGNDQANVLRGNAVSNALDGGKGNDSLFGNAGNDVLNGGDGDDYLDGGADNDTLIGGEGSDTYVIGQSIPDGVETIQETGTTGRDTIVSSISYTLELSGLGNIENLTLAAGSGATNATGNALNNDITGNALNNVLDGRAGADTLRGGAGDDLYLIEDDGIDTVIEAAGQGVDTIQTADDDITLVANVENLVLTNLDLHIAAGNSLNNLITDGAGQGIVAAETGNDTLRMGGGDDTAFGGDGHDLIEGGDGNDDLQGDTMLDGSSLASGNDTLLGGSGQDTLSGGAGNDFLDGGTGSDAMAGGAGDDYYVVEDDETDSVVELAGEGTDTVETDDIVYELGANVENLVLTNRGLHLGIGNSLGNLIVDGSGIGIVAAEGGDDTLRMGEDDDTAFGGDGNDWLDGGEGNDDLRGDLMNGGDGAAPGNDTLIGGGGNDTLNGERGSDLLIGGTGNDYYIVESDEVDTVVELAGEGTDTIETDDINIELGDHVENLVLTSQGLHIAVGNALNNLITDGAGLGIVAGEGGNDTLRMGDDDDTAFGGDGNDLLEGGNGNDELRGDVMNNGVNLAPGNDTLDGGAGVDTLAGGLGNDTYIVDTPFDVVEEDAGAGVDTLITRSTEVQLAANVENMTSADTGLTLTDGAYMIMYGNDLANVITGTNAAANWIEAGEGNDTLIGGTRNDILDGQGGVNRMQGGLGDDIYYIADANQDIVENQEEGRDSVVMQLAFNLELAANIENQYVLTPNQNPGAFITSLLGAFNVTGNGLSNRLTGSDGANTLLGLDGDDTIAGHGGADNLDGGEGNDSLLGGAGNDLISGGAGNDVLNGGSGSDSMAGGLGDDIYVLDSATDVVTEVVDGSEYGGMDTILSTVSVGVFQGVENITLQGSAAINAAGDDSDNTLRGNTGANLLQGNDGFDLLNGGDGNDTLEGGEGNDGLFGDAGADVMRGGLGDDSYQVTDATDVVTELAGEGYDTVYTTVENLTLAANVEDLWLQGSVIKGTGNSDANGIAGNDMDNQLYGEGGDDLLLGDQGFDRLYGGTGNDTLSGGDDLDFLFGGEGSDTYLVANLDDIITEQDASGTAVDRVSLLAHDYDDLWFQVSGTSLLVRDLNSDQVLSVSNWTAGAGNRVEEFYDATNGRLLSGSAIDQLISAMSAFGPMPTTAQQIAAAQSSLASTYANTWQIV